MKDHNHKLTNGQLGAAITVRVTPHSARNEINAIMEDGTISVCLTAAKIDEKSNQVLIEFLAQVLKVKPSNLEIVAGLSGFDKLITILDLDKSVVHERIMKNLS